jgi:hypothetical protein
LLECESLACEVIARNVKARAVSLIACFPSRKGRREEVGGGE